MQSDQLALNEREYQMRRENRRDALHFAALWLSGESGVMQTPDNVVDAARVFERFLNER